MLEVNKTYQIVNSRGNFIVKILAIEKDHLNSHVMQYHEDTSSKPVTYHEGKDHFHMPEYILSYFEIEEYKPTTK